MGERRAENRHTWGMGEAVMAGDAGESVRTSCQGVMVPRGCGRECQFVGSVCLEALGADDQIHFFVGRRRTRLGNKISLAAIKDLGLRNFLPF